MSPRALFIHLASVLLTRVHYWFCQSTFSSELLLFRVRMRWDILIMPQLRQLGAVFQSSEFMAKATCFSSKTPPETQPPGPVLILVLRITTLINVTDYTLGERRPQSWASQPKCLLAHKCEKSKCLLMLSHLCLRSFGRLQGGVWHLIFCLKWIFILLRQYFLCECVCVRQCLCV